MDEIREARTLSSDYHDEHGRLVQIWERYNKEYFGSELSPPLILLDEPQNEISYIEDLEIWGSFQRINGESRIEISTYIFRLPMGTDSPAFDEFLFWFASDILLHEMVHQQLGETGQIDVNELQHRGHGHKFADACNLVGEARELSPVYVNQRPFCYAWPQSALTNKQIEQAMGGLDFYEHYLADRMVRHLAQNGSDDGGPPTGGPTLVRQKSILAA